MVAPQLRPQGAALGCFQNQGLLCGGRMRLRKQVRIRSALIPPTVAILFTGLVVTGLIFTNLVASAPISYAAPTSGVNAQPVSKLKSGGSLLLPLSQEPRQFNPLHIDANDGELSRMMSASLPSLVVSDAQGKLTINKNYVSIFAQTKISPQILRIVLNPKAIWSDGKKIGLADFVGQWRALNGKNPSYEVLNSQGYANIKAIVAGKNANEILVTLTKPYPDWRELFSPLLPAALTKDAATFNTSWRAKPLLSAGPFSFDSINQEQGSITWIRNTKWWGAKPLLESIVYRILSQQVRYAAMMNDEIQFMEFGSDVSSIKLARKNPKLTINSVSGVDKWEHIELNSKNPLLADPLVRRAITVALNREAISEVNTGLLVSTPSIKNNRIFHAGQECYKDNSGKWGKQSVVLADQLLDDAGWSVATNSQEKDSSGKNKVIGMRYYSGAAKPGIVAQQPLTLKFTYPAENPARENVALLVQSMLRAKPIGIDLQLREVPKEDFFTKYVNPTSLDFDLTTFSWSSSILPISGAMPLYGKNSPQNFAKDSIPAELDALIKKTSAEIDPVKRCALANQVDAALWENAFNIPLYVWPGTTATVKNLANFGSFGWASIDWTKVGFIK